MAVLWHDFLAAFALMLVFEGIMPFWNPRSLRRMLETISRFDDRSIRLAGLFSMLAGALLLYIVR
jgi:uncharacterized protein YjeT (DUF2065 family)